MRPLWFKAIAVLAVVWLAAGGVMWWAKANQPTPESLLAYLENNPLGSRSSGDRAKIIGKAARQLNSLTYEQRREVRTHRQIDDFFRSMTPDEQSRFLDETLPEGFKQMMDALNKMDPAKRKEFVEKAVAEMKKDEGQPIPDDARERFEQDRNAQKIIDQGLKSFYREATVETKMDLAPLIEQMQRNLQGLR
jgi:hypothetical protein